MKRSSLNTAYDMNTQEYTYQTNHTKLPWYLSIWFMACLCVVMLVCIYISIILVLAYRVKQEVLLSLRSARASQNDKLFADINLSSSLTLAPISAGGVRQSGVSTILTSDDPAFGYPSAPIVIVAFEDFECPFSEEAFPIIRRVLSEYQDKIYFVYRDFPIISEHAHAQKAAEAAECANAQGKFWPYHDKLFQNQDHLADEYLTLYARQVGLDIEKFSACFASRKFTNEVQADYRDGIATGVRGTPTFFINGRKIEGVLSYDLFQEVIQKVSGKK